MKKSLSWIVFLILLISIVGISHHFWQESQQVQSTDDAYIEGDIIIISAELSAKITEVAIKDNQKVKKGDVLVRLESSDYDSHLQQAQRNLRAAKERVLAARANWELTRVQAQASINEEASGVRLAEAGVQSALSNVEQFRQRHRQVQVSKHTMLANLAKVSSEIEVAAAEQQRLEDDAKRYRALYAKDEISRQQMEQIETQKRQAQARLLAAQRQQQAAASQVNETEAAIAQAYQAVDSSQSQVTEAQARVDEARSRLASAQSAPDKIAVAWAQVQVANAEVRRAEVDVQLTQKDLERTVVRAPRDGIISKRTAQAGAFVAKGSPLMALVDPHIWILANYKETQLERVYPGLQAEVKVDTYPDKVFSAHVDSLQAGSGSRFSLLPAENASGNFVKVVQRIPVKLVFDEQPSPQTPLVPGMSVVSRILLHK